MSDEDAPWIMDFESIVAAIVLELGTDLDPLMLSDKALVVQALAKYYNLNAMWGFEEIAPVMAEQILNVVYKDR